MDSTDDQKYAQIATFLSGNATQDEAEQLDEWRTQSKENAIIFDNSVRIWNSSSPTISSQTIRQDKQDVTDQIIAQSLSTRKINSRRLWLVASAAAVLAPLILALGWNLGQSDKNDLDLSWHTISAPKKHIAIFKMADGSEVWLNAGSSLSYPSESLKDKREVKLSGEGYFKVSKDEGKPFFVITPRATVKVLGTTFNVKAYPTEDNIVTTLEEGSIAFYKGKPDVTPTVLHPGEQASFNTKTNSLKINKVDPALFSAWKGERFVFRDADLKTILTELERLYDIKIHINNPKLENRRFRGMFSYDEDLLDAFETLRHSVKMSYTIKGREVWLE